jgi:hypothetical protein
MALQGDAAVHKLFAQERALSAPPTPTQAPFDELEAALLLDATSGLGSIAGSGGGVLGDLASTTEAAGKAAHGKGNGGSSRPSQGAFLFDDLSASEAATAAARAHVSSTSWENANGVRGSGAQSDLHRAFAAAARARMSSRNPLARNAGGNLVGDVVLNSDGDVADAGFVPSGLLITPADAENLLDADEPALALLLSSMEADGGHLGTSP